MSSDPSLPGVDLPPSAVRRDDVYRTGRQIRYSVALMPWMLAYAEWLVLECIDRPKDIARVQRARALSRQGVNRGQLRLLEDREDFIAYCDELRKGPLERARAKFQSTFPTYIEAHAEALDGARRAGDYTAVARIVEPVLDRVMPKKIENAPAAMLTLVLTPQQISGVRAYEAPPILVQEAEVVEPAAPSDDRPSDD